MPAVPQEEHHILEENEVIDGIDELGVLLYGHDKGAYWFGSQLPTRKTQARSVPDRDWPAGDLGRARRHGLGAGEPECRHRRGRGNAISTAASASRCPISGR